MRCPEARRGAEAHGARPLGRYPAACGRRGDATRGAWSGRNSRLSDPSSSAALPVHTSWIINGHRNRQFDDLLPWAYIRSEENTSELQVTNAHLVCRLLLEKKN